MLLVWDSLQRYFSSGLDNGELTIITGLWLLRSIISLFLLLPGHAYLNRKKKKKPRRMKLNGVKTTDSRNLDSVQQILLSAYYL